MQPDATSDADTSLSDLVSGIVHDAQSLIGQQFTLLRRELADELRRAVRGLVSVATGAGIAAVGGVLLVLALVHGVHAWTALPLWACYAAVGGGLLLIGWLILHLGRRSVSEVHLMAPPQTTAALKENLEWLTHPTTPESS